jgi:phosphomevalonate kinase
MKTSESIKQIAEALVSAQKEIKFAVKDSTNPHYKSKYANINSVIDAVKAPLNNNNIAILQSLSPSDDGKLHLTTRLIHSSGEWIEDTAVCPLQKQDAQGLGSAVSYIRRYSLSAFLSLYSDTDDDGQSAALNAADYLQKINHSQTLEELQANYNFVMGEVKNDRTLSKMVIEAKDKRKAEL